MPETCRTCRFSKFVGTPDYECRRHPPVMVYRPERARQTEGVWPKVNPDEDWCGDYAPKVPNA
jgi:hypothetical protein